MKPVTRQKAITKENAAQLVQAAAADAATVAAIFRGHTQRMNRVFEVLKARTASFTFAETAYYMPKLKAALRDAGFNPGTLGRIWAAARWATDCKTPLSEWDAYMGKGGLDAAYEKSKRARVKVRADEADEEADEADENGETEAVTTASAVVSPSKPVSAFDAIKALLPQLTQEELIDLALLVELRMDLVLVDESEADLLEAA